MSLSCGGDTIPTNTLSTDGDYQAAESVLFLPTSAPEAGWGRAIILFTDEVRDCRTLPKRAPTLRALWKDPAIQGTGSGLLVWLQWIDLDQQTTDWAGRYLFGEAPVRTRQQHRAFLVPFENGVPNLDQPGRHGDIVIEPIHSDQVIGTIHSDRITGPFEAQNCVNL